MTRTFLASAIVASTFASACSPDAPLPPTAASRWLTAHAAPIQTIDPSASSDADLAPVGRAVGAATIVLLGEQTHGEGTTFQAKTRLVRYLHERLGFDVLAMESGLFACERAGDAIRDGRPAREMFAASVFDVWTRSRQFASLVDYVGRAASSERPLELTGFDLQLTGSLSRDTLRQELALMLPDSEDGRTVLDVVSTMTTSMARFRAIGRDRQEAFYAAAGRALAQLHGPVEADVRFMRQVVTSTVQYARFTWNADFERPVPEVMNIRDAQMADNLLWLARERYPGRKVIVWAATSHASRNRQRIRPPIPDPGMVPMGHHVWTALGPSSYVLAFTSGRGRFGSWRGAPTDLARPKDGSLEDAFDRTGMAFAFLDLEGTGGDGDWVAQPLAARFMGHTRMTATWHDLIDGVFFVKTAEPSTELE